MKIQVNIEPGLLEGVLSALVLITPKDSRASNFRPQIEQVHFEVMPGRLTMVATDGVRMLAADVIAHCAADGDSNNLVPTAPPVFGLQVSQAKLLLQILKARPKGLKEYGIEVDTEDRSVICTGGTRLEALCDSLKFPDWRRVMPKPGASLDAAQAPAPFNMERLQDVVKAMGMIAKADGDKYSRATATIEASGMYPRLVLRHDLGRNVEATAVLMGLRD